MVGCGGTHHWEDRDVNWTDFVRVFNQHYAPAYFLEAKADEFHSLYQGGKSVSEYECKFSELIMYVPHIHADDMARARRFIRGLLRLRIISSLNSDV